MADVVHVEVPHLDAAGGERVVAYFWCPAGQDLDERRLPDIGCPNQCNLQGNSRVGSINHNDWRGAAVATYGKEVMAACT